MIVINGFAGEYRWLSNFWIEPDGSSVESEFQAEKHHGHPWRMATILRSKPGRAKKLGRRWKLNTYQQMEWDNRKLEVMHKLVQRKVRDHPSVGVALVATAGIDLVEKNNWHDNFWGDCTCLRCYRVGENHLGQVWMDLRDEFTDDRRAA